MYCCQCPTVNFIRKSPSAVFPMRGTSDSVGFDLTAISVVKKLTEKTTLYDTGLVVKPPAGYYTEILPRSSLSKTGYVLANSVGIIDPDYRGTLMIALTKVDDSMPDLELPFMKCQLVLRKCSYFNMIEAEELDDTTRGAGGFGSTDKVDNHPPQ